jgi:hypothetical protein
MAVKIETRFTIYPTTERAAAVAAAAQAEDEDWTYVVVEVYKGFSVEIIDEDCEKVGKL